MSNDKPLWEAVYFRAIDDGLIKKLPQFNPKETISKISVSWQNVAPRTQKSVTIMLTNAGVTVSASNQNASAVNTLHRLAREQIDDPDLRLTEVREWMTGHKNFSLKPLPAVKKAGYKSREDALYKALALIIELLQPFV